MKNLCCGRMGNLALIILLTGFALKFMAGQESAPVAGAATDPPVTWHLEPKHRTARDLLLLCRNSIAPGCVMIANQTLNVLTVHGPADSAGQWKNELRYLDSDPEQQDMELTFYFVGYFFDEEYLPPSLPVPESLREPLAEGLQFTFKGKEYPARQYRLLHQEVLRVRCQAAREVQLLLPDFLNPRNTMIFTITIPDIQPDPNRSAGAFIQLNQVGWSATPLDEQGRPGIQYLSIKNGIGFGLGFSRKAEEEISPHAQLVIEPVPESKYRLSIQAAGRSVDRDIPFGGRRVAKEIVRIKQELTDPVSLECREVPLAETLSLLAGLTGQTFTIEGDRAPFEKPVSFRAWDVNTGEMLEKLSKAFHIKANWGTTFLTVRSGE